RWAARSSNNAIPQGFRTHQRSASTADRSVDPVLLPIHQLLCPDPGANVQRVQYDLDLGSNAVRCFPSGGPADSRTGLIDCNRYCSWPAGGFIPLAATADGANYGVLPCDSTDRVDSRVHAADWYWR